MAGHAGAIIFGGPMSATGTEDFVRREIDWIAVPLKEEKPFLGICLGAQMLAQHVGARVYHPRRRSRRDRLLPDPPDRASACRCAIRGRNRSISGIAKDSICPRGADLLAEGDSFPVQAFRYGSGYALQFHPDVTHATICRWTTRGHERTFLPNAKPRAAHFADRAVYDPAGRAWLAAFLNHWLGLRAG